MAYTTITDPSAYFQAQIYTGTSATHSVTFGGNSNLQPDWVWTKCRSNTSDHFLFDSTRGVQNQLHSNTNNAQGANATSLTSFNTDGWTMGTTGGMNYNSQTYVGWGWKANGGTTASNSNGSITSTVQADTTAGLSIVTYTGSGSNATIGHGLGVAPEIVLVKKYSSGTVRDWIMYGKALGNTKALMLNNTDSLYTLTDAWNSTTPTSTTFAIGTNGRVNDSGAYYVAYCFAGKQGYSKFGSYAGNGNVDGPFIYTGFKPAWIMIRRTDSSGDWLMLDSTRSRINVANNALKADSTAAENSGYWDVDLLSNGFKIRKADNELNGTNLFYMAFAENPFVATNGVPTTAR